MANGTSLKIKSTDGLPEAMAIIANEYDKAKKAGKNYFSRTVVVRQEETGKVFLGKAFKDRIAVFVQAAHIPLQVQVKRGKLVISE